MCQNLHFNKIPGDYVHIQVWEALFTVETKGGNIRILRESIPEDKYKSNDDCLIFCTYISYVKCNIVI